MFDREFAARAVLGSLRLEGLEPTEEMREATDRWVRGEADARELLAIAQRTAEASQPSPSASSAPVH